VIALVDYGAGNLTSVKKALTTLGAPFIVPEAPEQCTNASGLIVPGVGHFAATARLDASWREAIAGAVRAGTPLFGICVGMQWLYEGSEEAPDVPGLGLVAGRCRLLRGNAAERLKIPHVGWNALEIVSGANPSGSPGEPARLAPQGSRLLRGIPSGAHVYFTHSYAAPVTDDCVAATTHAEPFASAVEREHVFGAQFHPEKSGDTGLRILRNFLELTLARRSPAEAATC
jgi:glutamine amidotransferase